MYQIFHTDDVLPTKPTLNHRVRCEWCTSVINLGEPSLVNKVPNCFQIWITPSNVGFTNSQHIDRGLIQLHKNSVVDLSKSEKLQSLPDFWMNLVNTEKMQNTNYYAVLITSLL